MKVESEERKVAKVEYKGRKVRVGSEGKKKGESRLRGGTFLGHALSWLPSIEKAPRPCC